MDPIYKPNKQFLFNETEYNSATYSTMLPLTCDVCYKQYKRSKVGIRENLKWSKLNRFTCSKRCTGILRQIPKTSICCGNCNKPFERSTISVTNWFNKNKTKMFCSRPCATSYTNKHRIGGCNRSKAEIYLAGLIKQDFPNLLIEENNRKLLPSGYEIDILLPEIKFGIELNGPTHYLPIFGNKLLCETKLHDLTKAIEMQQLEYTLFVLDISMFSHFKHTKLFLNKEYTKNIKPFILNQL
jgi:hypothetical protein